MAHPDGGNLGTWGYAALIARREPHHGPCVVVAVVLQQMFHPVGSGRAAGLLELPVSDGADYSAVVGDTFPESHAYVFERGYVGLLSRV